MRVCGIDLETTGLDFEKDHITEIGWIIKDIGDPKPFVTKSSFIWPEETIIISDEIKELTKITEQHIALGGRTFRSVVQEIGEDLLRLKVDYIVAHNGANFDKPMLSRYAKRKGIEIAFRAPWLDTKHDIIYPARWSTSLTYVAAELGFLNPFPHSALFDVATMLKVLEHYDINQVIARSKEPWVVLKACVTYEDREKAKKKRFSWEQCGDKTYPKTWVKRVKASDAAKEVSEADFIIVILEDENGARAN